MTATDVPNFMLVSKYERRHPHSLRGFPLLLNEAERNTDPPRKHPRNARVISEQELGTMPKNNLRGITLVREPIWGIHSLTLMISW